MMTRHKSKVLYLAGLLCLFQGVFVGCGTTDFFNDTFLNTFFSIFGGSLRTINAKGPLTIVLENLTYEYRHQEYAEMGINYIDSDGNTMTVSNRTLYAVAKANRDPSSKDYDPSYREVIILDCGLQEIWFTSTVYRTKISEEEETIVLSTDSDLDITYATASVAKTKTDDVYKLTTSDFTSYTAVQTPSAHLLQDAHFECGDVILVGLLDARYSNRMIVPQTYEATYVDINSLSGTLTNENNIYTYTYTDVDGKEHSSTVTVYGSQYIADSNNAFLTAEYYYPTGYVLIPLALPNIEDVTTDTFSASSTLEDLAAEYAEN